MYGLIEDVIHDKDYSQFGIFDHYPLKSLIKNTGLLNEQELRYAVNPATHLDFIIYNRISKKPVLAIEVDGYRFHKNNTIQQARDAMKIILWSCVRFRCFGLRPTAVERKKR